MLGKKYCYLDTMYQKNYPLGKMLVSRQEYKPEDLLSGFLEERKRCYCTSLSFPHTIYDSKVKRTQQQNYDYFINTLAEMVEKYAPDILE